MFGWKASYCPLFRCRSGTHYLSKFKVEGASYILSLFSLSFFFFFFFFGCTFAIFSLVKLKYTFSLPIYPPIHGGRNFGCLRMHPNFPSLYNLPALCHSSPLFFFPSGTSLIQTKQCFLITCNHATNATM